MISTIMHIIGNCIVIHMNVYPSYIPRNHVHNETFVCDSFPPIKKFGIGQIMYSNASMSTTIEYKVNFVGNKLKVYFSSFTH
jgi:hypothetical protein